MTSWYIASSCMASFQAFLITTGPVPSVFHGCRSRARHPCRTRGSCGAEELLGLPHPVGEGVHIGEGVVEVERRAGGRRDAEAAADRPGAVVADADLDAQVVQDLPHV